jgi:DNA-directed RNA polymerase specialized sigma24 family protein
MQAADPTDPSAPAPRPEALVEAAFRELHGPSLHGFALLLTLGERRPAAVLAADALDGAAAQLASLRHPERAAAWLRRRVTRSAGGGDRRLASAERLAALHDMEVSPAALAGLSALSRLERAGLIAVAVERLDLRDVGTIVGRDGKRLDRLLRTARRRYLAGATASPADLEGPPGPIRQRIAASAARTMA